MIRIFYLALFSSLILNFGCSSNQKVVYKIKTKTSAKNLSTNDTLFFALNTTKDVSNHYFLWNETPIEHGYLIPEYTGEQKIKAIIETESGSKEISKNIRVYSPVKPKVYGYKLLNTYPHDIQAYTQGLEFVGETLYESTGQYGKSSLRKVNYTSGEVIQKLPLAKSFFAEGLTYMNGSIIQLTWKKKMGFVYNPSDLTLKKSFSYDQSPEGWGLCNDGNFLYKTDGSQKLWTLDPETFKEIDSKDIVTHNTFLSKVNELEYANGLIFGNTYQFNKDVVVIIDPKTGVVVGVVDFSGLKKQVRQHNQLDVFNGIAYHPGRNTFFVTGKYWDKLFEVEIFEK